MQAKQPNSIFKQHEVRWLFCSCFVQTYAIGNTFMYNRR